MTVMVSSDAVVLTASTVPAAVAELAGCSFSTLADDDVLGVLRLAERARRQLEALDHVLIAELEARNLPGRYVLRGSKQLLAGLLTLSPAESGARVRHAHALGPRTSLTGERLAPLLPVTAAARAEGALTGRQVEVSSPRWPGCVLPSCRSSSRRTRRRSWSSRRAASTLPLWPESPAGCWTLWIPTAGWPRSAASSGGGS
jgi:hypothetical protein